MASRLAIAGMVAIGCATVCGAAERSGGTLASNAKSISVLDLENKRLVSLLTFEVVIPGAAKAEREEVVGRLSKPLAAGHSVKLRLGKRSGCIFDIRWKFEDVGDAGSVDLCRDAHIVLTD